MGLFSRQRHVPQQPVASAPERAAVSSKHGRRNASEDTMQTPHGSRPSSRLRWLSKSPMRLLSGRTSPLGSEHPTNMGSPDVRSLRAEQGPEKLAATAPEDSLTRPSTNTLETWERNTSSDSPTLSTASRQRSRSADALARWRSDTIVGKPISNPHSFQHMCHLGPQHFSKLDDKVGDEFIADFAAMRASQSMRHDFRGIKAVDLHSRNSSVETATTSLSPSDVSSRLSPTTSYTDSTRTSVHSMDLLSKPRTHIRAQRSQDSFSQPFVGGRLPKIEPKTEPIVAPPVRTSSRHAVNGRRRQGHNRFQSSVSTTSGTIEINSAHQRGGSNTFDPATEVDTSRLHSNAMGFSPLAAVSEEEARASLMSSHSGSNAEKTAASREVGRPGTGHDHTQPTEQAPPLALKSCLRPSKTSTKLKRSSTSSGLFTGWASDNDDASEYGDSVARSASKRTQVKTVKVQSPASSRHASQAVPSRRDHR